MKNTDYWSKVFTVLRKIRAAYDLPSVSKIAREFSNDPYKILTSTVISLRTKDKVTLESSYQLFEKAQNFEELMKLDVDAIREAIYPCAYYRVKAENLKRIATIISGQHKGSIPDSAEDLLSLPGVGRKTANLVLNLAFHKQAVCVDTHVHRVSNQLGWVDSKTPEKTEYRLMETVPQKYWIELNEELIIIGQNFCKPRNPKCKHCPISSYCDSAAFQDL
ncbi:MAG: endonuclease III domain-containing protein [Spirochaetia bacterium]